MLGNTSRMDKGDQEVTSLALHDSRTTWVVMQFGLATRPTVNVSHDLRLALENFFQLLRLVASIKIVSKFKIASEDHDPSMCGLTVFVDDKVVLTLQPAMRLREDRERGSLMPDVQGNFRDIARILLAAIDARNDLIPAEADKLATTSVGLSFVINADEKLLAQALTEESARSIVDPVVSDAVWQMMLNANTKLALPE